MPKILHHATRITGHREHELIGVALLQSALDVLPGDRLGGLHLQLFDADVASPGRPMALSAWSGMGGISTLRSPLVPPPPASAPPETVMQGLRDGRRVNTQVTREPSSADAPWGHALWLPASCNGDLLGVLRVLSREPLPEPFAALLAALCTLYANHVSLLHDSQLDTLTRLHNRKTFDACIGRLLAERAGTAWLAVLDIDHFKRINDNYGHLFGDEVLLLIADILRTSFHGRDHVFRFGGEEFVVLLDDTHREGALLALERCREAVELRRFPQVGQVTVSIGASCARLGDTSSDLLGRADEALYHAKQHGRNRCCLYEDLVSAGEIVPSAAHSEVDLF